MTNVHQAPHERLPCSADFRVCRFWLGQLLSPFQSPVHENRLRRSPTARSFHVPNPIIGFTRFASTIWILELLWSLAVPIIGFGFWNFHFTMHPLARQSRSPQQIASYPLSTIHYQLTPADTGQHRMPPSGDFPLNT